MTNEPNHNDELICSIAEIIDHPSVYMGGPSRNAMRIAANIVEHHRADLTPADDKDATIARLTAERDRWRNDCLDANQSELELRKRAEQAEAAGTFAQGIEAAAKVAETFYGTGTMQRIRALSPTPQTDPACVACEDNPTAPNIPCAICGKSGVLKADPVREAASNLMPYLEWTIGPESPGHHPTMPSAVAHLDRALADERKEGE